MAEGIDAYLHFVVWICLVVVVAVASPLVLLAYAVVQGERPLWPVFWRRYRAALSHALTAL